MRLVGPESQKTYHDKLNNGFFLKYMSGRGLDVGYAGYETGRGTILSTAIGIEPSYPGYNGTHLPFPDNSQDYVYSSHCLEHINNYQEVIKDWLRVVKPGGYIITIVPHRDLYEKKLELPSIWNADHRRFYSPASLLREFEESLPINSFRVRHLQDNDEGHDYNQPINEHSKGQYEIELVIRKL